MEAKLFFYKLNAADFFAEVRRHDSDEELGKWTRNLAADLIANESNDEFTKAMIAEAETSRVKKSKAGKVGMDIRYGKANTDTASLEQCYNSDITNNSINTSNSTNNNIKNKKSKSSANFEGSDEIFEKCWEAYPRRIGKKLALKHFNASVKTIEEARELYDAIESYIDQTKGKEEQFIKHGSTFFNNWRDYVVPEEDE